jgi:hypothetical protein
MPTGVGTPIIPQTQLELGPAAWFRPEPENPPGNQVRVKFGFGLAGGQAVIDQGADQLTAGFASVGAPGFKRYDLVFLDLTGVVQIAQGVEVAAASPGFDGAPGFNLGPPLPTGNPVAYVLVDETGAVTVDKADIFQINGFIHLARDLEGYLVDKGLFGAAPAGTSDVVTALFASETRIVPVTGATEPNSGGDPTQAGVVTDPPLNFTHLLDQKGDEILHTSGARMYGRLTEAAGVWTLAYYYIDNAGVETAMDPSTDATVAPTDLQLAGVPKVFSRNDPARPLFDSPVARQTDQVAGDIPIATPTIYGKVKKIADGSSTDADAALATTDARVGAVQGRRNADAVTGYQPVVRLIEGTNVTIALAEAGGELQFTINSTASGAFPGFGGVPGADSAAGSAGASGLASRSDHNHPRSDIYRIDADLYYTPLSTGNVVTTVPSFRPRFGLVLTKNEGGDFSAGAWGVNPAGSVIQMSTVNHGNNSSWSSVYVGGGGGATHSSYQYVLQPVSYGVALTFVRTGSSPGATINFGSWCFGDKFQ